MPPGPSTANLSSYAPSRQVFSDASGIVNAEVAGLGDANVNPLMDIAEGIDKGLDLAYKANKFIESISPQAAEERRLNLEIKRAQAAVQQQQGQAAQIQMAADAVNQEVLLESAILKPTLELNKQRSQLKQAKVFQEAVTGLGQIQDIGSFDAFLKDPKYGVLRTVPEFKEQIAIKASDLIGTTSDPVQQASLYRTATMAAPGSEKIFEGMLSTEAQRLIADPKELAEIELKRSQAKNQLSEASKRDVEVGTLQAQAEAQKAEAAKPPYDPIASALSQAGVTATGEVPATQSPPPIPGTAPAPGTPGGPVAPRTAEQITQGQQSGQTSTTGAPAKPVTQADLDVARVRESEKHKAIIDRVVATEGTPGYETQKAIAADIRRNNPGIDGTTFNKMFEAATSVSSLTPKEYEDHQQFKDSLQNLKVNSLRLQSAFKTLDAYIATGNDPNLGKQETLGQLKDYIFGSSQFNALNSEEKKTLGSAIQELEGQGLAAALTNLASMKVGGNNASLMNSDVEREGMKALFTGKNLTYEKNRQALEILNAKIQDGENMLYIMDAYKRFGYNYQQGVDSADQYRRLYPNITVGTINGIPQVVQKGPGQVPPADHIWNKLNLDKYMDRNKEGRVVPSVPAHVPSLANDVSEKIERGEKIPIPKASDVSDRMSKASPALIMRVMATESDLQPRAISKKNAQGLMQVRPGTGEEVWNKYAGELGFEGEYDPFDTRKNILVGTTYLNQQLRDFNGDTRLALAAYNAGPGRLKEIVKAYDTANEKLGSVDYASVSQYLPQETQNYVKKIMGDGEEISKESPSLSQVEYHGAFESLPTSEARSQAQRILSQEGVEALHSTNNIKTIADTKGTILESVMTALLDANPFRGAETAEAQTVEETGSDDTRTRTLNDDGSVSIEGDSGNDSNAVIPNDTVTMPVIESTPSTEERGGGRQIFDELNPFGASIAEAQTLEERGNAALAKIDAARTQPKAAPLSTGPKQPAQEGTDFPDSLQAFSLGAVRGLAFGGDRYLGAALRMAVHGETWDQAWDAATNIRSEFSKNNPKIYVSGDLFGSAVGIGKAGKLFQLAKGAKATQKTAQGATAIETALASQKAKGVVQIAKETIPAAAGYSATRGAIEAPTGKKLENAVVHGAIGAGAAIVLAPFIRVGAKLINTETAQNLFSKIASSSVGQKAATVGRALTTDVKDLATKGIRPPKASPTKYTDAEIILLQHLAKSSDQTPSQILKKLAEQGDETAASILSESGGQIDSMVAHVAKDPQVLARASRLAERNLTAEGEKVRAALNKVSDDVSSAEAYETGKAVINKHLSRIYEQRRQQADLLYGEAADVAAKNNYQSYSKYGRWRFAQPVENESVIYGGGSTARTTAQKHDQMVDDALSKRQITRTETEAAPETAVFGVTEKPNTTPEGIGGSSMRSKVEPSTEAPHNVYGVPESKVQRYRQPEAIPPETRPAFNSDELFKVINENGHASKTLIEAKRMVDPEDVLEANDFYVQQALNHLLGEKAKLPGIEGNYYRTAHNAVQKAQYAENDAYRIADEKWKEFTDKIVDTQDKAFEKIYKFSAEGGVLDSSKLGPAFIDSLGVEEIKGLMGKLTVEEQQAFKNVARSYILDSLEKRPARVAGEGQNFPDFTKNKLPAKFKAVFGEDVGAEISKDLQTIANTSKASSSILEAGEKQAPHITVEEETAAAKVAHAGLAGAAALAYPNPATQLYAAGRGLQAFISVLKTQKLKSERAVADEFLKITFENPAAQKATLDKIIKHVEKEDPNSVEVWKRIATLVGVEAAGNTQTDTKSTKSTFKENLNNPSGPKITR